MKNIRIILNRYHDNIQMREDLLLLAKQELKEINEIFKEIETKEKEKPVKGQISIFRSE